MSSITDKIPRFHTFVGYNRQISGIHHFCRLYTARIPPDTAFHPPIGTILQLIHRTDPAQPSIRVSGTAPPIHHRQSPNLPTPPGTQHKKNACSGTDTSSSIPATGGFSFSERLLDVQVVVALFLLQHLVVIRRAVQINQAVEEKLRRREKRQISHLPEIILEQRMQHMRTVTVQLIPRLPRHRHGILPVGLQLPARLQHPRGETRARENENHVVLADGHTSPASAAG